MAKVFINYRRVDSKAPTSRLAKELKEKLGKKEVFIDESDMEAGVWNEQLEKEIFNCRAFVVVIGKQWHLCQNPDTGIRRISDPDDVVRREIELALQHTKQIILLCVDGATLPLRKSLKDDPITKTIEVILDYQKFDLDVNQTPHRYSADLDKLIEAIQKITSQPEEINRPQRLQLLEKSVKELLDVRNYDNDVVLFKVRLAHVLNSLLSFVEIDVYTRRSIYVLVDVYAQLFLSLNLWRLYHTFDKKTFDKKLMGEVMHLVNQIFNSEYELDHHNINIRKEVTELLDSPANDGLFSVMKIGASTIAAVRDKPLDDLPTFIPMGFNASVQLLNEFLNAHKTSIQSVDKDINKVTAEELLERIIQVEAELERIAAG